MSATEQGLALRSSTGERGARGVWFENEPPHDGTPVVAIGRVIYSDDFSTSVDPFLSAIRWFKDDSGFEGWHYAHTGLTVDRELGDEVKIDFWVPMPDQQVKEDSQ